jgi:hypothetical protein
LKVILKGTTMTHVLALDIAGTPFRWMEPREAIHYHAAGKVAWELGAELAVFRGGVSRTGVRSQLVTRSVIALAKSEAMVKWARETLPLKHDNRMLFKRDRYLCAYCGDSFDRRDLTRDHILPLSRRGADTWVNVVTACKPCNHTKKRNRTPDEAGLPLLYVPYAPCRSEYFILSGRRILADQMAYLLARVPRGSRLHNA